MSVWVSRAAMRARPMRGQNAETGWQGRFPVYLCVPRDNVHRSGDRAEARWQGWFPVYLCTDLGTKMHMGMVRCIEMGVQMGLMEPQRRVRD